MHNPKVFQSPVAQSIPFDNSTNDFDSDNVQDAIEEIGASASPGFSWGRSGTIISGTWLSNESVPSNKAGRTVVISNPKIVKIFSATEDQDTYTLEIYEHDGNEINLTLLTSLSVVSSRVGDSGTISINMTSGKQLAVKLSAGSAKNIVVGTILKGST